MYFRVYQTASGSDSDSSNYIDLEEYPDIKEVEGEIEKTLGDSESGYYEEWVNETFLVIEVDDLEELVEFEEWAGEEIIIISRTRTFEPARYEGSILKDLEVYNHYRE